MGPEEIKGLQEEFSKSWGQLKGLLDQQADEIRTHGETHGKTADGIKSIEGRLSQLDAEVKGFTDKYKDLETKYGRPHFGGGERAKSVGEQVIESEAYKSMISSGSNSSSPIRVDMQRKATLTSGTAGGGAGNLTTALRVPEIIVAPNPLLTIRDLLQVTSTTANAITYIEETGFTNAAAPVAETNLKPESALTFGVKTESVKTIAHWIPATRQIVADAAQLQSYIDNRLLYGLAAVEEAQILFGTGVGENLSGIMTNPNIQDAGAAGTASMIDHIRHSITLATMAGYPVTGVVLNVQDWETIEISKGSDGHYIWVNVSDGGQPRLWAVPVVQSLGMTQGQFLAGSFGLGSQLWIREDANVRVSEHHADYFTRNMLAILAESRATLTTYRPESFVKGSFA